MMGYQMTGSIGKRWTGLRSLETAYTQHIMANRWHGEPTTEASQDADMD